MGGTREYHPELGKPVTKVHAWYLFTDKWILAQELRIPKKKFTEQMMLQEKEDKSVDASVLSRKENKVLMRDKVWSRD